MANPWGEDEGGFSGEPSLPDSLPTFTRVPSKASWTVDEDDAADVGWGGGGGFASGGEASTSTLTSAALDEPAPYRHEDLGWDAPVPLSPVAAHDSGPSPSFRPSTPPVPASTHAAEPEAVHEVEDSDWGEYGNDPVLPPLTTSFEIAESPTVSKGWGQEEDWKPPQEALPSFGDSFASEATTNDRGEEGWGIEREAMSWDGKARRESTDDDPESHDREDGQAWGGTGERRSGKSIPAALVNGLKADSRRFGNDNWKGSGEEPQGVRETSDGTSPLLTSLSQPPAPISQPANSSHPPITSETPLSTLFRLTPTLYPAFQEGLDKTALRAAETLKGTASSAYRHARFGRGTLAKGSGSTSVVGEDPTKPVPGMWNVESGLGTPELHSERGQADDEFDLDAPAAVAAKGRWWSKGETAPTNTPRSVLTIKPTSPTSPAAAPSPPHTGDSTAPSAIGRFLNRFSKPPTVSASTSRSNSPSNTEFSGESTFLDDGSATTTKVFIDVSKEAAAEFDTIFGDTSKRAPVTAIAGPRADGFGGLMTGFGEATVPRAARAGKAKAVDIFDPFGDHDEPVLSPTLSSTMVPTRRSIDSHRTSSPAPRVLSPALLPTPTRSPSYPSPLQTLAAPQARAVPAPVPLADDPLDDFFSSIAPIPARLSPRGISAPLRTSNLLPTCTATISPPIQSSSGNPLRSTKSPIGFGFAPPPPPIQPLRSATSTTLLDSLAAPTSVRAASPAVARVLAPKGTGGLSSDDLSFFENL